jgi:hypothetical protein
MSTYKNTHAPAVFEFDANDGMALRIAVVPGENKFGLVIMKNGEKMAPVLVIDDVNVAAIISDTFRNGLTNMRRCKDGWEPVGYTAVPEVLEPLNIQEKVRRVR